MSRGIFNLHIPTHLFLTQTKCEPLASEFVTRAVYKEYGIARCGIHMTRFTFILYKPFTYLWHVTIHKFVMHPFSDRPLLSASLATIWDRIPASRL